MKKVKLAAEEKRIRGNLRAAELRRAKKEKRDAEEKRLKVNLRAKILRKEKRGRLEYQTKALRDNVLGHEALILLKKTETNKRPFMERK